MWLYVPLECYRFFREAEGLTSESTPQPEAELGPYVTSSGKPLQRPASWPGWKRRPWHRLLSGMTCPRSTLERGVAQWIASWAALPVKTSPSPASELASTASAAASSTNTSASSASPKPPSSSGRTSEEQLLLFPESSKPSPAPASVAPASPFVLLTWEPLTAAPASSCWPTAVTSDSRSSARHTTTATAMQPGTSLTDAMRSPERFKARSARLTAQGTRPLGANLGQQAQGWRTPTARDGSGTGGADPEVRLEQGHSVGLKDQVTTWPTPNASDEKWRYLQQDAALRRMETGKQVSLECAAVAQKWPTPAARDGKGANGPEHLAKARGHHDQLPNAVVMSGLPALLTSTDGAPTSRPAAPLRLNPAFVEALMGWPKGWSIPRAGSTDCGCSETASSPNRPPQPGDSLPHTSSEAGE